MRLRLLENLKTPAPRGTTPIAISDKGVLVVEEEGSVDGDEGAVELVNPKDSFAVLPELNPDIAMHWYICGPSGSGKSTAANKVAEQFRKITGGLVIVLSMDTDDDSSFPCADVRLGVEKAAELTLEDLMGELDEETGERQRTLVCFDDHLSGADKLTTIAVLALQRAVVERGRKFGVSSLSTSHRAAQSSATKAVLNGMSHFVLFPVHGAGRSFKYVLEQYCSVPSEIVSLIRRDPAGWGRCCTLEFPRLCAASASAEPWY